MCPLATLNVVKIVAVFSQVFGVGGVEGKTVAACFKFSNTVITFPVFIA